MIGIIPTRVRRDYNVGKHALLLGMATGALIALVYPSQASANPYDISLRGLGRPAQNSSLDDPAVRRYRRLANELTMSMLPRPLAPAETLGLNGFEFAIGSTITNINWNAPHWTGQPGNPVFEGAATGQAVPQVLWTPTASIRKGLPLSMEVGLSGSYLAWSEMFMLSAEYKIAWHESFFRWAPALSTRVAFSRLFGSSDLDIISGEADVMTSLPIGIGGMVQLTPYAGYGLVFPHINSQVIDETPYEVLDNQDQQGGARGSLYTFPTINWHDNGQGRFIAGARFIVAFVELVFEFNWMMINLFDSSANPTGGPALNDLYSFSAKLGFDV